ncbi:MAG: hypothetical protein RLZ72_572 [Actinomycetota bacterium]
MAEFLDRVFDVAIRIRDIVMHIVAWIVWAARVVAHFVRHYAPIVAPYTKTFGRTAAFLVAGLIIPFIGNHGNTIGLQWLVFISIVSLAIRDDRLGIISRAVWWINVLFTGAALLGLVIGRISAVSALSLAIPVVLLECARGFIRGERVAGWGSAALALILTIIVFPSTEDTTAATGFIGAWAIILGVFAAISHSETLMAKGKQAISRVTKR